MRITLWPRICYPLIGPLPDVAEANHLHLICILVPASSADCGRMFSELGDLLEARRMKMRQLARVITVASGIALDCLLCPQLLQPGLIALIYFAVGLRSSGPVDI